MFFMLQYIFFTFDFIYSLLDFQLLLGLIGYIKLIFLTQSSKTLQLKTEEKSLHVFHLFPP